MISRPEAERLVERRTALRGARDFPAADAIRARLQAAGWDLVDTTSGSELRRVDPLPAGRRLTYLTILHGWPDDAELWLSSVTGHAPGVDFEVLLALNAPQAALHSWARRSGEADRRVRVLVLDPPVGFGAAVNRAVEAAAGEVVVLMEPGTELEGQLAEPLLSALEEPGVGLAGAFGLRGRGTPKEFADHPGPEVDAVEGYCVAFRKRDFVAAGGFDERFRFYRIADIEFSFRMRSAGHRAVVVPGLPLRRHAHRLWEATAEEERERLSRKNLYRFLDRWGKRSDLLLG
ncbi:MAG: glycosyltransferase [Candidatus Dormibacteraceae bacterium]